MQPSSDPGPNGGNSLRSTSITSTAPIPPNRERFDHIISEKSIATWIIKFGTRADRLLRLGGTTFVDTQGVRRYVSNWKPAEELTPTIQNEKLLEQTGCRRVAVECTFDQIDIQRGETNHKVVHASFLNDWQRLWSFLVQDNEDEVAQHAPLFRILIEFFFHKRTCQLMYLLYVYMMIMLVILHVFYGHGVSLMLLVIGYTNPTAHVLTYTAMMLFYKGQITAFMNSDSFYHQRQQDQQMRSFPHNPPAPSEHTVDPNITVYSTHWTATVRQLIVEASREVCLLCGCGKKTVTVTNNIDRLHRNVSYYYLLNVALKFLTRHNGIDTKQMNFDRPTYRFALLFAVLVYPWYIIIVQLLVPYASQVYSVCSGDNDNVCNYFTNVLYFTGGGFVNFSIAYIFGASLMIGLVGLAYGGEIIFRLVDSWLQKFCCLRRVNSEDKSAKLVFDKPFKQESKDTSSSRKVNSRYAVDDNDSDSDNTYSALHKLSGTVKDNTTSMNVKDDRVQLQSSNVDATDDATSDVTISQLISRDASEHYLFIRELVETASGLWSSALTGVVILLCYIVAAYLSFIVVYLDALTVVVTSYLFLYICIRFIVMIIYPVISISHANSYIYELKQSFEGSGPDDFSLIGGRKRWIQFIESCPIVWTYFGLWITYDRLEGVLSTCILGLGALIGTYIQNNT